MPLGRAVPFALCRVWFLACPSCSAQGLTIAGSWWALREEQPPELCWWCLVCAVCVAGLCPLAVLRWQGLSFHLLISTMLNKLIYKVPPDTSQNSGGNVIHAVPKHRAMEQCSSHALVSARDKRRYPLACP